MEVFTSKEWLCCTGSGIAGPAVLQSSITSIVFMLTGYGGVSLLLLMPEVLEGARVWVEELGVLVECG